MIDHRALCLARLMSAVAGFRLRGWWRRWRVEVQAVVATCLTVGNEFSDEFWTIEIESQSLSAMGSEL